MLSFRKKIIISDIILFLIFLAFLILIVGNTVKAVIKRNIVKQTKELISEIENKEDLESIRQALQEKENYVFFRYCLINQDRKRLYDSHKEKVLDYTYKEHHVLKSLEVKNAIETGFGYHEEYSIIFNQPFAYVAIKFQSHGKDYILRTAFPFKQIEDVTRNFEIGFLTFGAFILLLYSLMTWGIIHKLSRPIQQIINAIKHYKEEKDEFLSHIKLDKTIGLNDDFGKLASTINSLSQTIQKRIQELKDQHSENKAILESLVEGILSVNEENKITFVNSKACQMLEKEKDEICFKKLNNIDDHHKIFQKCEKLIIKSLSQNEILSCSLLIKDEKKTYLNIIAIPRAQKKGVILVLQDKTADYKVLQLGKDFIANASHELKTPITIIGGFAEALCDYPQMKMSMKKEVSSKILKTCKRLTNIVQNLLTLAEVDNIAKSHFVDCNVSILIHNAVHMLKLYHENVDVKIDDQIKELYILAQPPLLELALLNILENSVKYSENHPQIVVELKSLDNMIHISIQDKGIGIPKADLEHIFDRFYTVDKARSKKMGGTGLGLSIVNNVIEKHEGKIFAKSEMGKGTEFIIALPQMEKVLI
jgi:two-component system, OmpR family, phosphate regulon sensor histidine kinase PhoR